MTNATTRRPAPRRRNAALEELQSRAQDVRSKRDAGKVLRYFARLEGSAESEIVRAAACRCAILMQEIVDGMLDGTCAPVIELKRGRLFAAMSKLATALGGSTDVDVDVKTVQPGTNALTAPEFFEGALLIHLARNRKRWTAETLDDQDAFFASVSGASKSDAVSQFRRIVQGYALADRRWS